MGKRIAVNTRFLLKDKLEGFGKFTWEVCKRMAAEHPEDEFIFLFDRNFDPSFITEDNITPVVLQPQCRHPVLFKMWFNYAVPKALKKYKADVFFSPDGYLSLRTDVPQVGVIHDINFEHFPNDIPQNASIYLRNHFPKFARLAKEIITVSEYSKKDIIYNYGISPDKIKVAYNGKSESFQPISEDEKLSFRKEFSNGNSYFLFIGSLHPRKNLVNMLLAFDHYKMQNFDSGNQLVIVGDPYWWNEDMKSVLDQLTFGKDIKYTGHLPEDQLTKLTAAAHALLFVSYFEGFGIPIVEAFQSQIPVICGNRTSLPEISGDAAYLVNPFDVNEIAYAMQQVDENEQLRNVLIEKGKDRLHLFNWDQTAEICYTSIKKSITD